jgi:hypothetical protein
MAVVPSNQDSTGREIKVYDNTRQPRDWNALLTPSQCAVFFKRIDSQVPLSSDGTPLHRFRDCTFLLFDSLEDARRLCEAKVQQYPHMCCEIYDSKGKALPPILVVEHPSVTEKDELSAASVRKRRTIAVLLFLAALPLFWWDWRGGNALIVPTYLGFTMILSGLRVLYWNSARGEHAKNQKKRIEAHLQRERESGLDAR